MEEAVGCALPGTEPGGYRVQQLSLPVLFGNDILVWPGFPVGNRLPPRGIGN